MPPTVMPPNGPASSLPDGPTAGLRELHDHAFRIKKDGYTVLRCVWSPERCRVARERLDELRAEAEAAAAPGPIMTGEAFGCSHLYNKGEAFEGVYQSPLVLALVRHFLGEDATIMSLGDHGVYGHIMPPANHAERRHWGDETGLHNDGSLTGA
jgi:hypothetical protein